MKKLFLTIIICLFASNVWAFPPTPPTSQTASGSTTDTSNFDGSLSVADDTVQKALDTFDDVPPGSGAGTDLHYVTTQAEGTLSNESVVNSAATVESVFNLGAFASDILSVTNEAGFFGLMPTYFNQALLNTSNPSFNTVNNYGGPITTGTGSTATGGIVMKNSTNNFILNRFPGVTTETWTITEATSPPAGDAYLVHRNMDGTEGYTDPASLGDGIDWTSDQSPTYSIHINNLPDLSSLYLPLWDFDYTDLINKPTIPSSIGDLSPAYTDIVSLWTSCTSGFLAYDGSCSTPEGGGDVSKVGTPAQYQWGVWTGDGTLKGVTIAGNTALIGTDANGEPEAKSGLSGIKVNIGAADTLNTAGDLTRQTTDIIQMRNNANDGNLTFVPTDDSATNGDTLKGWSADKVYDQLQLRTLKVASGSATFNPTSIASGACSSVVDGGTATGVATTDVIDWGFSGDPTSTTGYAPSASGGLYIVAYPTSDHVNFKACNNTAGAIDPDSVTLNWKVNR